jgi:hypothetical protein
MELRGFEMGVLYWIVRRAATEGHKPLIKQLVCAAKLAWMRMPPPAGYEAFSIVTE